MKRTGFLYEKIIDKNNILLAIYNASKRKRNRPDVKRVLNDVDKHVDKIHKYLTDDNFELSPFLIQTIVDNSSGKIRTIQKPKFFPDQCIHWTIMQIVEPILNKGMDYYCCASVKGRGGKRGQAAVKKWLKNDPRNTKYTLQLDVSKFYPSVDQDILIKLLWRKIKDKRCMSLLIKIIRSNDKGLPLGNYSSPIFANFYLQGLDHFAKEKLGVKYMVRYMDDIVIFGPNKKKLHKARKAIDSYLKQLKLTIKGNWQVFKTNSRPIDFLGYRFYRDHVTMRRRNALRIKRRVKKIYRKDKLNFKDASAIVSYLGWIYHSDSRYFYKKHLKPFINIKKMKGVIRNESRKRRNA